MRSLKIFVAAVMAVVFICGTAFAAKEAQTVARIGEGLVREIWENMRNKDWDTLEDMMADGFQSVRQDGANYKQQQMELMKKLNLSDYRLTDFMVTSDGPLMIVTYKVSVAETLKGRRLDAEPAMRLSAFIKTDGEWKWVIHANLRPLMQ